METTYKTIIVTFKESIDRLNGIFDAPQTWGASTLKEWVDAYESSRLVQIGKNTVVITSEYNMPSIVEWLQRYTPIEILQED
ncbi:MULTISPECIES: DUF6956 domain-containing protein [Bacteroides]|jgi:hypothetical protein|uniref:DUF6956 domain-containing protein n=1 Tax=Bacteroides TaxID=816 RepID=UPI00202EBEA8|nr:MULTISPECIES: hypothetical protein [Bacteroides]MCM0337377.1 hypothetical protein [Bacteroides fragilis]MDA3619689.1 hypothetical protein [Bacteroides sp. 47]